MDTTTPRLAGDAETATRSSEPTELDWRELVEDRKRLFRRLTIALAIGLAAVFAFVPCWTSQPDSYDARPSGKPVEGVPPPLPVAKTPPGNSAASASSHAQQSAALPSK